MMNNSVCFLSVFKIKRFLVIFFFAFTESYREYLHAVFLLPVMIPLFRWNNIYNFKESLKDSGGFLVCPHFGIKRNTGVFHLCIYLPFLQIEMR